MDFAIIAGVLGAMGGILKLVLDHSDRQQERFELFLENHMSKNTEAMQLVAQALQDLTEAVNNGR
jgi:hypothetical protein